MTKLCILLDASTVYKCTKIHNVFENLQSISLLIQNDSDNVERLFWK